MSFLACEENNMVHSEELRVYKGAYVAGILSRMAQTVGRENNEN
jgi:hypothetical protein